MSRFLPLIGLLCWIGASAVFAQPPDLGRIPTIAGKLKTLEAYNRRENLAENYQAMIPTSRLALQLLKKAPNDTLNTVFLYYLGLGYEYTNRPDSAIACYEQSDRVARRIHHLPRQVKARLRLIDLYTEAGKKESVNSLLTDVEDRARQSRDEELLAETQSFLGNYYQSEYQHEKAVAYILKSLRYYQKIKYTIGIGVQLGGLGSTYYQDAQYRKSLLYLWEAIPYLTDYQHGLAICYNNLGMDYEKLHQPDSALYCFQQSVRVAQNAQNQYALTKAYQGMGSVSMALRRYPQANHYLRMSLRLADSLNLYLDAMNVAQLLGQLAYRQKNYPVAKAYFEKVLVNASQIQNKAYLLEAHKDLATVAAALRQYEQAYEYRTLGAQYQDSIHAESSSRNIAEMEARYQTENKQQQIALLHQQNRANRLEMTVQRRNQYFLCAGIALVLVIAGLLFRSYRLKQQSSRQLADKNLALQSTNQQLALLNEKLGEANQAKTKLFGILSHDLRTPISSLFQLLNLQRENPDLLSEEKRQQHQTRIADSAEGLLETLEELLLWSKSQLEAFTPAAEPLLVEPLLEEARLLYQPLADQRHLKLSQQCPPGLFIRSDANYLRLILRNLLSNALKFTPQGGAVSLAVELVEEGQIRLSVVDNGEGMSEQQLSQLFDWQHVKGLQSGLGLSLTREFAQKLGGELSVASRPREGTRFSVVFPAPVLSPPVAYFQ